MSRFFIGQRVRVIASEGGNPHLIGTETRVIDRIDSKYIIDLRDLNGCNYWAYEHQLTPILPPGHQPSEFATLADLLTSLNVSVSA